MFAGPRKARSPGEHLLARVNSASRVMFCGVVCVILASVTALSARHSLRPARLLPDSFGIEIRKRPLGEVASSHLNPTSFASPPISEFQGRRSPGGLSCFQDSAGLLRDVATRPSAFASDY